MKTKIPAKAAVRLLENTAFLNSQHGVAFNGMITLNFEQLGLVGEQAAARALTKLNEAVADRIHRHGQRYSPELKLPHFFIYAHEHVETHGHHAHELVVLPPGLDADFPEWLKAWARRNYGPSIDLRAIHYKGRYYRNDKERAEQQARLVRYVLKSSENARMAATGGGATTLHEVLRIDEPNRAYAAPVRRMVGSSQNIGHRAQLAANYQYPPALDDSLTGVHLDAYRARILAEKFQAQLRSIDF